MSSQKNLNGKITSRDTKRALRNKNANKTTVLLRESNYVLI